MTVLYHFLKDLFGKRATLVFSVGFLLVAVFTKLKEVWVLPVLHRINGVWLWWVLLTAVFLFGVMLPIYNIWAQSERGRSVLYRMSVWNRNRPLKALLKRHGISKDLAALLCGGYGAGGWTPDRVSELTLSGLGYCGGDILFTTRGATLQEEIKKMGFSAELWRSL